MTEASNTNSLAVASSASPLDSPTPAMRSRKAPRVDLTFTDGETTDVVGRFSPLEPIGEVGEKHAVGGGLMEKDDAGSIRLVTKVERKKV